MELNKKKINKRALFQLFLISLGILIIFFTYFNNEKQGSPSKKQDKKVTSEKDSSVDEVSTFEDVEYTGFDANENKFIINSDNAEFTNTQPNLIYMKQVYCRFFFKDGTILEIISDKGLYDNITNDMEFENNVKMFYLENKIFAEKANFINSENYLFVENNVVAEAPEGNLAADKLNFDLNEKKLRISMYNDDKVNIKVNY